MIEGKYAEIRDLNSRGAIRAGLRAVFTGGENMITVRYVLPIKSGEDRKNRYEARFVAEGHLDIMKDTLVQGSKTIQCVSVCILLIIIGTKESRIWVVEVRLVYL